MKSTLLITTLALCLTGTAWLKAQDADTSTPPAPPAPGEGHHHWGPPMSDADRAKVKAAYDTAMQNADLKAEGDALKQQEQDFHKKLHDAMVAADPSVEPLLAKMHHHMPMDGTPPPAPEGDGGNQ